MTATLLLLCGLNVGVLPSDAQTVLLIVPNDPLKYGFDQVRVGVSEQKALALVGRKVAQAEQNGAPLTGNRINSRSGGGRATSYAF
jgi:hypothetical protein